MALDRFHAYAAVGMSLVVSSSQAFPTVDKFVHWLPVGPGMTLNPRADGLGLMRIDRQNMTHLALAMHSLEPNTTYGVQITRDGLVGYTNPQAFTTNSWGNSLFHAEFSEGGEIGAPAVIIFVWDPVANPDPGADVVTVGEQRLFSLPS